MKLTLFAMISFLAVTVSASAIPGDSDYSVSRLEKRMGDEPYEEADEDVEVDESFFERRERALKSAAKRYEKQREMERVLREDIETLKDALEQSGLPGSEKKDLENQLGAAIKAFEAHSASMKASYKQMKAAEMTYSPKMVGKDILQKHQNRLKEHNVNDPDDPLEVESGSVYNRIILGEQMNEACERENDALEDMNATKVKSSEVLDKMAEKGSDDEDDSTPSATSSLTEYLSSIVKHQAYKRKCLYISKL
ncbi:hypothetical protein BASA50_008460 [Batrachochytrium salamandrivorans]|uniref:Uncharacterized protein n=1 Tax=Batrachochytrium salamandrivorans TaxID=1357716 RepID=A0ABQ8F437_9FUNG|nr:hypothetical protein BASA50_008460 [Batrachochytrium salamandrivorans]